MISIRVCYHQLSMAHKYPNPSFLSFLWNVENIYDGELLEKGESQSRFLPCSKNKPISWTHIKLDKEIVNKYCMGT